MLVRAVSHSWVDPRNVKSDKKLLYEYRLAWARAMAAQEILDFVQKSIEDAEHLTKKERGEIEDKLRSGVS